MWEGVVFIHHLDDTLFSVKSYKCHNQGNYLCVRCISQFPCHLTTENKTKMSNKSFSWQQLEYIFAYSDTWYILYCCWLTVLLFAVTHAMKFISSRMAAIQPLTIAILYNFIFPKLQFILFSLHFILLLVLPEMELAKPLMSKQLRGMKKKRWQIREQMLASGEIYLGQQDISSWINTWSSGITHWKQFHFLCAHLKMPYYAVKKSETQQKEVFVSHYMFLRAYEAWQLKRGRFSEFHKLFISFYVSMLPFHFVQPLFSPKLSFFLNEKIRPCYLSRKI